MIKKIKLKKGKLPDDTLVGNDDSNDEGVRPAPEVEYSTETAKIEAGDGDPLSVQDSYREPPGSLTEHLETADGDSGFDEAVRDTAASLDGLTDAGDYEGPEQTAEVKIVDDDIEINAGSAEPIEFPADAAIGHEDPTKEYQGLDQEGETIPDQVFDDSGDSRDSGDGDAEQSLGNFEDGWMNENKDSIESDSSDLRQIEKDSPIASSLKTETRLGRRIVPYVAATLLGAIGITALTYSIIPQKIEDFFSKNPLQRTPAVEVAQNGTDTPDSVEKYLDKQYGKDRLERPLEDILDCVTATPAFDEPQPDPYDIDPNPKPKEPLTDYIGTLDSAPQGASLTQIAAAMLGEGQQGTNFLELSQAEQTRLLNEIYVSNVTSQYTPEQVKNVLSLAMILQDQNPQAVRNPINTEKLSGYKQLIELAKDPTNAILLRGVALNLTSSLEAVEDGPIFTGTPVVEHYPPQEEPDEYSVQPDITKDLEVVQPEVTDSLEMVLEEPYEQETTQGRVQKPIVDPRIAWKEEFIAQAQAYHNGDDIELGEPEELELDTDEVPDVTEALEEYSSPVETELVTEIPDVTEDLVDTELTVVQDDGVVDTGLAAILDPSPSSRTAQVRSSIGPSTMPREEVAVYTHEFLDAYKLAQTSSVDSWKGDAVALAMHAAQAYTENPKAFDSPKEKRLLRSMQEFYDFDESERLEAAIGHYFTQQEKNEWFEDQDLDLDVRDIATIYSVQPSKLKKSINNVERIEEHSLRYEVGENISSILASTDHSRSQLYSDLRFAGINAVADRTVTLYEGYQQAKEENPELTKIGYAREHADSYGVTAETLAGNMTDTAYAVAQEAVEASGESSSQTSAKKSA